MRRLTPMILGALVSIPLAGGHAARAVEHPNLSGTWILNQKASDDPAEKMREAMRGRGEGRRGGSPFGGHGGLGAGNGGGEMGGGIPMGGGSMGGGPMGEGPMGEGTGGGRIGGMAGRRMGGGGEGRFDGGAARERMQRREAGAKSLEITHAEPRLTVKDANGDAWMATTDGKAVKVHGVEGADTEIAAQWQPGDRLVVSRTADSGSRITETYELVAEGQRLLVKVRLESSGRAGSGVEFQRVYDRRQAGAAPAAPAPAPASSGAGSGRAGAVPA